MPPRRSSVTRSNVKIDIKKHEEKLKEIDARRASDRRLNEYDEEGEGEEEMSEECEEEEEEELVVLSFEDATKVGLIDLSFPENREEFETSEQCYPPSYYTLSIKERLTLMYVENFRHQFVIKNRYRRPLVLALPNECNVQVSKTVSSSRNHQFKIVNYQLNINR